MVFYGYILPSTNLEARQKDLQLSLKNEQLKNLNALTFASSLEQNSISEASTSGSTSEVDKFNQLMKNNEKLRNILPSVVSELGLTTPNSVPNTPKTTNGVLSDAVLKVLNDPNVADSKKSAIPSNLNAFQSELQKAVVKRELSIAEKQSVDNFEKKIESNPTFETFKEAYAESSTVLADFDSDYLKSYKKSPDTLAKVLQSAMEDSGFKKITVYNNVNEPSKTQRSITFKEDKNGKLEAQYTVGKSTRSMTLRQLYATLQHASKNNDGLIVGSGLIRSKYYTSNAPNFGNLYLNQNSLKRSNLSISQPYSKTYILSKKNITPLLKKMIFDIANTLEFDSADYHNLDRDEKVIIEKIIRAQKNMKDVNISKLLDDDDRKIKKRLEILVGEINAGNNSSLIRKEMKELLKKLFDNRAISFSKYNQSIKSLKALD